MIFFFPDEFCLRKIWVISEKKKKKILWNSIALEVDQIYVENT